MKLLLFCSALFVCSNTVAKAKYMCIQYPVKSCFFYQLMSEKYFMEPSCNIELNSFEKKILTHDSGTVFSIITIPSDNGPFYSLTILYSNNEYVNYSHLVKLDLRKGERVIKNTSIGTGIYNKRTKKYSVILMVSIKKADKRIVNYTNNNLFEWLKKINK